MGDNCSPQGPVSQSSLHYDVGVGISVSSNSVAKKVPLLAFLPPWSCGKDPDRYIGIGGNSTADEVITVVNGPVFKTLKNHLESSGLLGCQVGSTVKLGDGRLGGLYLGDNCSPHKPVNQSLLHYKVWVRITISSNLVAKKVSLPAFCQSGPMVRTLIVTRGGVPTSR
jgi:hypothetical protein